MEKKKNSIAKIQFVEGWEETVVPTIKLTKSKNGKTGTATFVFLFPDIFFQIQQNSRKFTVIEKMSLHWKKEKKITTNDLFVFFSNGKPYGIKVILILKNPQEWFEFLSFMKEYSNEVGLFFSQTENNLSSLSSENSSETHFEEGE